VNPDDAAATVLRLAAAAIFIGQAVRKLAAAHDAPHGRGNLAAMIRRAGMPQPERLALAVSITEAVGGAALLIGLATRPAAVVLAGVMAVAIVGFKRAQGFLGGWDWPFAVLAILVGVALLGAGPWSVDSVIASR
jgi:putative oxidoreductase